MAKGRSSGKRKSKASSESSSGPKRPAVLTDGQKFFLQRITGAISLDEDEMIALYLDIRSSFGMGVETLADEDYVDNDEGKASLIR